VGTLCPLSPRAQHARHASTARGMERAGQCGAVAAVTECGPGTALSECAAQPWPAGCQHQAVQVGGELSSHCITCCPAWLALLAASQSCMLTWRLLTWHASQHAQHDLHVSKMRGCLKRRSAHAGISCVSTPPSAGRQSSSRHWSSHAVGTRRAVAPHGVQAALPGACQLLLSTTPIAVLPPTLLVAACPTAHTSATHSLPHVATHPALPAQPPAKYFSLPAYSAHCQLLPPVDTLPYHVPPFPPASGCRLVHSPPVDQPRCGLAVGRH